LSDLIQTRHGGSIPCDCPVMPLLSIQLKKHHVFLDSRHKANAVKAHLSNVTHIFLFLYDISREVRVILQQYGRKLISAVNIYYTSQ
jgi:hypothetical protein